MKYFYYIYIGHLLNCNLRHTESVAARAMIPQSGQWQRRQRHIDQVGDDPAADDKCVRIRISGGHLFGHRIDVKLIQQAALIRHSSQTKYAKVFAPPAPLPPVAQPCPTSYS